MRRLGELLPLKPGLSGHSYSRQARAHRPDPAHSPRRKSHLSSYSPLRLHIIHHPHQHHCHFNASKTLPSRSQSNRLLHSTHFISFRNPRCDNPRRICFRRKLPKRYEHICLGRNIVDLVWQSDRIYIYPKMLLPSAIPCDAFSRRSPASCLQLLPSPPCDSVTSARITTNIQSTCHALQSLLTTSSSTYPRFSIASRPLTRRVCPSESQIPLLESPIAMNRSASDPLSRIQPFFSENLNTENSTTVYPPQSKQSSRPRPPLFRRPAAISTSALLNNPSQATSPVRRPVLRNPITILPSTKELTQPRSPPRGQNKRRRSSVDETSFSTTHCSGGTSTPPPSENLPPSTPKRRRLVPPSIPRGLAREDFDDLQPPPSLTESMPARQSCTKSSHSLCSCSSTTWPLSPTPLSPELISSSSSKEDLDALFWLDTSSVVGSTDNAPYLLSLILQKLRLRQHDKQELVGVSKRTLPATGERKMWF